MDGDVVGDDVACLAGLDRDGVVARGLEALDAHAVVAHAVLEQRLLHERHERAGAAEIGVARLKALHRRHDLLGLGDALRGVEMMDDLQPSGMGLHQRLELGVEDHRLLVAVGIEQTDLPLAAL